MKKVIATLLMLSILYLTACNNEKFETSTSTSNTEQIESTSISQSTETTRNTQISATTSTSQTEETQENKNIQVSEDLKDKIIISHYGVVFDFPSRIVFSQSSKDKLVGTSYRGVGDNKIVYYSKADGEVYVNCFDPLCDHKDCAVTKFAITSKYMSVYNDRFYSFEFGRGEIYSFSFDGSDIRLEYQMFDHDLEGLLPFKGYRAYDRYCYISYLHEDGTKHCLRFDIETGEMVDLTEQTGIYAFPSFFYNGKMYLNAEDGTIKKYNLDLTGGEDTDIVFKDNFLFTHTVGSTFIGYIREWVEDENGNRMVTYPGIYTYDIETGKETFISSETIGKNVIYTLYADENYVYFISDDKGEYIGKSRSGADVYNSGTLYRVNRDGTNCICIYKNSKMSFSAIYPIMIYKDKIFVYSSETGFVGEYVQTWNKGMYIGTIQADGKIDKLEYIEIIE